MAFSTVLPANPIAIYWPYWDTRRCTALSDIYNMFFLFQCVPDDGSPNFRPAGSIRLIKNTTASSEAQYEADVQALRTAGKKAILTVGGAGAQVDLSTTARVTQCVNDIKAIYTDLGGFDGVDWNAFEQSIVPPDGISSASQQLKAEYGDDFIICAPPTTSGANLASPGTQAINDRLLMATMYRDEVLDWFCPQFYDGPGNDITSTVRNAMNFYKATITIDGQNVTIPDSTMGIGYGVWSTGTPNPHYWTAAETKTDYETMVSEGQHPKGAFNFSSVIDATDTFATTTGPIITNNSGAPGGSGGGSGQTGGFEEITKIRTMTDTAINEIRTIAFNTISAIRGNIMTSDTDNFFNEKFETGSTPWTFTSVGNVSGDAVVALDTTSKVVGTNSLAFSATGQGEATAVRNIGEDVTDQFIQIRGFVPTVFALGASNYTGFLDIRDSSNNQLIRFNMETSTLDLTIAGGDWNPGFTDTTVDIPKNSVYRLEIQITKSATTGRIRVWLNNTTEGSPDYDSGNVDSGATAFRTIRFGGTFIPEAITDSYYFDNIMHDSSFIGTRGD